MANKQAQQEGMPLRSGYFDRDAFRQKKRMILVLQTAIAGLFYNVNESLEEDRELLESLTPGTELHLFRDPDNEYDKWAISVYTTDDRELGYVTRFKNETIARLMDVGKTFRAFVDERPETKEELESIGKTRASTEDYRLPFSVYLEE